MESVYETRPAPSAHRQWLEQPLPLGLTRATIALTAIIVLAACLRFYRLETVGTANQYYTAAVESMLQSWHNFFFVAAEPGGSVSVDKPPLGLWIQAVSAYFLGVSGFSVVLPQALAGVICIPIVYHLVRRTSGVAAGLIAALVLSITPVAVAAERNNTMDATLVLTLLLAAWSFLRATDGGRLRWVLLGALLVGLGFNIKMLQAFLVVPAFYFLYLFCAPVGWGRKALHLVAATLVLMAVSLSWAIAVDLTPADQRPYVGSSENNTVMELIVGHNGFSRLLGGFWRRPAGLMLPPVDGAPGVQLAPEQPPAGQGPMGTDEVGKPGALRLFVAPLANEAGWLLPFGLAGIALATLSTPVRMPFSDTHKAVVLWGGWLLACAGFFSVAGLIHAYYLIMLAPPLAALVGIGCASLWALYQKHQFAALTLLLGSASVTVALQMGIAADYTGVPLWIGLVGLLGLASAGLLILYLVMRDQVLIRLGGLGLLASMFAIPAIWSALTALAAPNVALPRAYEGTIGPIRNSDEPRNVNDELLVYLQDHTQDVEYLVAVPSSIQGAGYVIATGRPVLYMGGFSGSDPVVDVDSLAAIVQQGRLRYILWNEGRGPRDGEISAWLRSSCIVIEEMSAGVDSGGPPIGPDAPEPERRTLYQCGG